MEASDPFNTAVESPEGDPFGEEVTQDDPFGDEGEAGATAEPLAGVPVVDKEGQPVDAETQNGASPAAEEEAEKPTEKPADPPTADGATASEDEGASSEAPGAAAGSKKEAPKPAATQSKRPYRVLTPDGDGKWQEVTWFEDKDGKMVAEGTAGAKRQRFANVHNKDAALRIGYRALGSPPDGCRLVALADAWFQVKHVKPEQVPDPRVRVTIS